MAYIFIILMLLATPAYAIQMIGFGAGGGGGAGTLLVGDNTYNGATYKLATTNHLYTSDSTAVESGTANTAWIYYYDENPEVCKVCIYEAGDTGAKLECVAVPRTGGTGSGWMSAAMAGTLSIVATTSYRLGAVCNGYTNIGSNTDVYLYNLGTGASYDTPPATNDWDSREYEGVLNVYITN